MVQLNARAPAKNSELLAETCCECARPDTWGKTLPFLSAELHSGTKPLFTLPCVPFETGQTPRSKRVRRNCAVSSGLRMSFPQTQSAPCGYVASVSLFTRRSTMKFLLTCLTTQLSTDCH
eukprot:scaffold11091_cov75-Phaeocystis_antarctica.AAC.13